MELLTVVIVVIVVVFASILALLMTCCIRRNLKIEKSFRRGLDDLETTTRAEHEEKVCTTVPHETAERQNIVELPCSSMCLPSGKYSRIQSLLKLLQMSPKPLAKRANTASYDGPPRLSLHLNRSSSLLPRKLFMGSNSNISTLHATNAVSPQSTSTTSANYLCHRNELVDVSSKRPSGVPTLSSLIVLNGSVTAIQRRGSSLTRTTAADSDMSSITNSKTSGRYLKGSSNKPLPKQPRNEGESPVSVYLPGQCRRPAIVPNSTPASIQALETQTSPSSRGTPPRGGDMLAGSTLGTRTTEIKTSPIATAPQQSHMLQPSISQENCLCESSQPDSCPHRLPSSDGQGPQQQSSYIQQFPMPVTPVTPLTPSTPIVPGDLPARSPYRTPSNGPDNGLLSPMMITSATRRSRLNAPEPSLESPTSLSSYKVSSKSQFTQGVAQPGGVTGVVSISSSGSDLKNISQKGVIATLRGGAYEAVYPYTPQLSDELPLETGDKLFVYSVFDDGWCFARLFSRQRGEGPLRDGICPLACLANLTNE